MDVSPYSHATSVSSGDYLRLPSGNGYNAGYHYDDIVSTPTQSSFNDQSNFSPHVDSQSFHTPYSYASPSLDQAFYSPLNNTPRSRKHRSTVKHKTYTGHSSPQQTGHLRKRAPYNASQLSRRAPAAADGRPITKSSDDTAEVACTLIPEYVVKLSPCVFNCLQSLAYQYVVSNNPPCSFVPGDSRLHALASYGYVSEEAIWEEIQRGAVVTAVNDQRDTPLHYCVRGAYMHGIDILCSNGAAINGMDCTGCTVFISATLLSNYSENLIRQLHLYGADASALSLQGSTAIMAVLAKYIFMPEQASGQILEELSFLIQCGIEVNYACNYGVTAGHLAVILNSYPVVEFLLRHGTHFNISADDGSTAASLALSLNYTTLLPLVTGGVSKDMSYDDNTKASGLPGTGNLEIKKSLFRDSNIDVISQNVTCCRAFNSGLSIFPTIENEIIPVATNSGTRGVHGSEESGSAKHISLSSNIAQGSIVPYRPTLTRDNILIFGYLPTHGSALTRTTHVLTSILSTESSITDTEATLSASLNDLSQTSCCSQELDATQSGRVNVTQLEPCSTVETLSLEPSGLLNTTADGSSGEKNIPSTYYPKSTAVSRRRYSFPQCGLDQYVTDSSGVSQTGNEQKTNCMTTPSEIVDVILRKNGIIDKFQSAQLDYLIEQNTEIHPWIGSLTADDELYYWNPDSSESAWYLPDALVGTAYEPMHIDDAMSTQEDNSSSNEHNPNQEGGSGLGKENKQLEIWTTFFNKVAESHQPVSPVTEIPTDVSETRRKTIQKLRKALKQGKPEKVKALIASGTLPPLEDCLDEGKRSMNPIHTVCFKGDSRLLEALVEKEKEKNGQEVLHRAINALDSLGNAGIHILVLNKRFSQEVRACIRILAENGCDKNLRNAEGDCALHMAVTAYNSPAISMLLEIGADVNALNDKGKTATQIVDEMENNEELSSTQASSLRKDLGYITERERESSTPESFNSAEPHHNNQESSWLQSVAATVSSLVYASPPRAPEPESKPTEPCLPPIHVAEGVGLTRKALRKNAFGRRGTNDIDSPTSTGASKGGSYDPTSRETPGPDNDATKGEVGRSPNVFDRYVNTFADG